VLYTRKVDKCRSLILSNLRVSYLGAHRDHREGGGIISTVAQLKQLIF
jgi:hypothetical protein